MLQIDGNISLSLSESDEHVFKVDDLNEKYFENTTWKNSLQTDGNKSLSPSEADDISPTNYISVVTGNRPPAKPHINIDRIPCRRTIRRDNRGELGLFLPNIAVYNHRSIWKKVKNFCLEFKELSMGIAFHSEIWEKRESKKHKFKIDEMLELEGINYISTARPDRRGGGCAITCDVSKFHLKEINLSNPDNLEVTFATLRPKSERSPQFLIILCAVYSPPNSRKKTKLVDFISESYNFLKSTKYPSAYFALGGDINDLKVDLLLDISPRFSQIVSRPTRGQKTLSVIVTDLAEFYQTPIILPPIQPDVLGVGKPSDHSVPFATTYLDRAKPREKNYKLKMVRPFPQSGIFEFGRWVQSENFSCLDASVTPTDMVDTLETMVATKVEQIFPYKEIKIYQGDKEFMTPCLRKLRRQKSREYMKNKKSEKFIELHKKFRQVREENSKEYVKKIEELKECNLGQFFKKIKEVGARQGEYSETSFSLSSHLELNLDPKSAAEKIAEHFSSISKEYPPIDEQKLPQRVKEKIFHPDVALKSPKLEEFEVYEMLKKRKAKNSSVPGDIPSKLKKEFLPEFSGPSSKIFNTITKTGLYPRQWVTEYVTPIPKVTPPETEDDLRNISLTADMSKDYENFLAQWLMPYILKRIDPGQFGGLSRHSTSHYLITLFHFILANTDPSSFPKAVMLALIDFSKAFNRINHAKVIVRLSDWGVPGWLLRILISYLTGRSMILRYKGVHSARHLMPGGSPQGALLGVLLYLVYVSDIGMDLPMIPPQPHGTLDLPSVPSPSPAVTDLEARLKFVDDLSLAECLRLDSNLTPSKELIGPRNYHDRNGLVLPPEQSRLQKRLHEVSESADLHDMKLNLSKTKIMPFNFTKKYDFVPTFSIDGNPIDVVYKSKLLGLTITSDCRWDENTKNFVKKGNSRLWFIRRLKLLGACEGTLLDIYKLFCRSVLEFGAPVWSGALSVKNSQDIERVQRNAMKIISNSFNTSYNDFLEQIEEETLSTRRETLCLSFAQKCLKTDKFGAWFTKGVETRSGSCYFVETDTKTKRFHNSAIPYLTRLLNLNNSTK